MAGAAGAAVADGALSVTAHRIHGGLHLDPRKDAASQLPPAAAFIPSVLVLPLHQHIGTAAEPVVRPGQRVLKGETVARAAEYLCVPVHAPTSGIVRAIEDRPVPHASGLPAPAVVIEPDGEDQWMERSAARGLLDMDPSELRNRVRSAGVVGLGGAAFPSFIKLNPGPERRVDTLVLNGAECEPYICCDDALMRHRPAEIVAGARIVMHALGAARCLIGIEDNKPEALSSMREATAAEADMQVVAVPTVYPAGGEKQLIFALTGREVPSNRLPADIGVVCHNVATVAAVHRAIDLGEPLISRIVTVAGGAVPQAVNIEVLIGTPVREVIERCGGYREQPERLLMGGPMMGFQVHDDDAPVIKATNCLLVATADDLGPAHAAVPCIRCGRCADVCPAQLLPQQLYWHARGGDLDTVQDYGLFDCIECGCCAYVCPSHIPLVQFYRHAKHDIWAREIDRQRAEQAKRRSEFRSFRLEREERERQERHAAKKAQLQARKHDAGAGKRPGGGEPPA